MDFNDNKYTVEAVKPNEQDDKTELLLDETSEPVSY